MPRKIRPVAIARHEFLKLPLALQFGKGEPLMDTACEQIVLVGGLRGSNPRDPAPMLFREVPELLSNTRIAILIHVDPPFIRQPSMFSVCSSRKRRSVRWRT